jgi:hypothetical protein
MQLTIEKKVETKEYKNIEIETPCFFKIGCSFVKVTDTVCLGVHNSDSVKSMTIYTPQNDGSAILHWVNYGTKITEEAFNAAYHAFHNETAAIVQPKLLKTA